MKNQIVKNLKKVLALALVIMLNINTYAAVSSNDQSAFITVPEFDAFVEDFIADINDFEKSITSKIDGSIANYLSGLDTKFSKDFTVGYFAGIPSSISSITMRAYSSFSYNGGNPNVYFTGVFGSTYTNIYAFAGYGYINYTGSDNGYRRLVTQDGSTYRWYGYTTNYRESHNVTWGGNQGSSDTGYDKNGTVYCYVPVLTSLSSSSSSTGNYWGNIRWRLGDSDQGHGLFYPSACTNYTTFNNYTVNYKYDLMYDDYPSSSQSANNMRCFVPSNPNNRWFAGSSVSYLTVTANGSRGGSCRVNADGVVTKSISSYNYITSSSYNTAYYTCGFEPNITSWSKVYNYDTQVYKSGTTQISNYSMIDGAAFGEVKKGYEYTWPVSFTNTSSVTNIWIKYGVFNGPPGSDADIKNNNDYISFKVDSAEESKKGAVTGKGTIKFVAPKSGILFFKWTSGRSMYVSASSKASYTYDLLDPNIERNN